MIHTLCLHLPGAEEDKDQRKLAFTMQALCTADPFVKDTNVPHDVMSALEWQSVRSPEQVRCEREFIVNQFEIAGADMWKSGRCLEWFVGCDAVVQGVSKTINGPMMQDLASAAGHEDVHFPEVFRCGPLCACGLFMLLFLQFVRRPALWGA